MVAGCREDDIIGELVDWKGENCTTRDAVTRVYRAMLAASPPAPAAEPVALGPRPCDCERCDCGNVGDAQAVAAWDERAASTHPLDAAAIRALADKGEAEGWRPIETAPKDGTEIILFGPYPEGEEGHSTNRVTAGFWCAPEPPVIGDCGGPCRCPEYGEPIEPYWASMHGGSDSGWMSTDGGFTTEWPPTHWRPLPAPPAGGRDNARD